MFLCSPCSPAPPDFDFATSTGCTTVMMFASSNIMTVLYVARGDHGNPYRTREPSANNSTRSNTQCMSLCPPAPPGFDLAASAGGTTVMYLFTNFQQQNTELWDSYDHLAMHSSAMRSCSVDSSTPAWACSRRPGPVTWTGLGHAPSPGLL